VGSGGCLLVGCCQGAAELSTRCRACADELLVVVLGMQGGSGRRAAVAAAAKAASLSSKGRRSAGVAGDNAIPVPRNAGAL
jgi:hypothetical protein